MTRSTGTPKILVGGSAITPSRVSLQASDIDEGWLQDQLDRHPELLPLDDIGSSWGPLVSLGREVPTQVGPIDNLFVSPTGELTVVEAKLWRNPEARRKVVGQVLDYAACLARLSYEELDEAVSDASAGERSLWSSVAGFAGLEPQDEAIFHDTVSRNLAAGRFLLLIVGDGIRTDVEGLADLLGGSPDLGFHLELVEMKLYQLESDGLLIVPSLVARTEEVGRFVVKLNGADNGDFTVVVDSPPPADKERSRPIPSVESFIEQASELIGSEAAEAAGGFIDHWEAGGGTVKRNRRSINLGASFAPNSGGSVSIVTLRLDGSVQLSVASFAEWQECLPIEQARQLAAKHGFTHGASNWPYRSIDLSDETERLGLSELMEIVSQAVKDEESRLALAAEV